MSQRQTSDPAATRNIEQVLLRMAAEGTKIILTTHDLAQARRLSAEIMFMQHGVVVEHSAGDAFFAAPMSQLARAYLRGELID